MITSTYTQVLRRRVVQRFIREQGRAPTPDEITVLLKQEAAAYPTVDTTGVSGYDIVRPHFGDESSVTIENKNRKALVDDAVAANTRLQELQRLLEDGFRGFMATVSRVDKLLTGQEARVDKLLLLNSNVDVFVSGIEETFDVCDHVVFDRTTASVENGYVVLGRGGLATVELASAQVGVSAVTDGTLLSYRATAPTSALKASDGQVYELLVYTREQLARTTAVIDIVLPAPTDIQQVELTGLPLELNKHCTVTVAYSLDGTSFAILEPAERVMQAETVFDLGLKGVQKVQIRLAKNAADVKTTSENQWVTVFSLDSVRLYTSAYVSAATSELIAGPYLIADPEGNDVFFTKATLGCCTVEPEGTSISWFLGVDGTTWSPVDPARASLSVLSTGAGVASQVVEYVDNAAPPGSLTEAVAELEGVDYGHEAVLNSFIAAAGVASVPVRSIQIKRNIRGAAGDVLGQPRGWYVDSVTGRYTTTVYVSESAGRWIDLGSTSAIVGGQETSGRVYFAPGYTRFSTDDKNWEAINSGAMTATELQAMDALYPHNHRYLVEGYAYPPGYEGERIYTGTTSICGRVLSYLPVEEFDHLDEAEPRFFSVFTVDTSADGDAYFKVKVNKQDPTWVNETYEIDWVVQGGPTNGVYVKAVLASNVPTQTPIIESFNVRVI